AAASSDLVGGGGVDLYRQPSRAAPHDAAYVLVAVKLQMLAHLKPIPQWGRQHTCSRRRANQGEWPERQIDSPRVDTFTEHDVDPEVFHRGVQVLFDGLRHAMDFVDE